MKLLLLDLSEIPAGPASRPGNPAEQRDQGKEHRHSDEEHDSPWHRVVVGTEARDPNEADEHDRHERGHGEGDSPLLGQRDEGLLLDG